MGFTIDLQGSDEFNDHVLSVSKLAEGLHGRVAIFFSKYQISRDSEPAHSFHKTYQLFEDLLTVSGSRTFSLEELVHAAQNLIARVDEVIQFSKSNIVVSEDDIAAMQSATVRLATGLATVKAALYDGDLNEQKATGSIRKLIILENKVQELTDGFAETSAARRALQNDMNGLQNQFGQLVEYGTTQVQKADALLDSYRAHFEEKGREIDNIIGTLAAKAIVGSYQESAAAEKIAANQFRIMAIVIMLAIVGIVGYSLLELSKPDFDLQASTLRIIFSLVLSVPAAYLARESSRHRSQHYNHNQTALDLLSISPYIASLPKERQDFLKEAIALKIFSPKKSSSAPDDTFPINIQELLMAIVKRRDLREDKN